jgi:hypothetical protein
MTAFLVVAVVSRLIRLTRICIQKKRGVRTWQGYRYHDKCCNGGGNVDAVKINNDSTGSFKVENGKQQGRLMMSDRKEAVFDMDEKWRRKSETQVVKSSLVNLKGEL